MNGDPCLEHACFSGFDSSLLGQWWQSPRRLGAYHSLVMSMIFTTEATCLPVFHKMPGSQENFGKNHTHHQTVVGPQTPW